MKLDLDNVKADLKPFGAGSRIRAGGVDISRLIDEVTVKTSADKGTSIQMRCALADCRVAGRGEIIGPHPDTAELLPIAEIVFKDGRRWRAE